MTYKELQIELASRGFTYTPITIKQFDLLKRAGIKDSDIVGVAIDVGCGFPIGESINAL
tara:strand:- start:1101 stop:1277 length:177 start_codon:yes stop_codon:yes gene_type:complete